MLVKRRVVRGTLWVIVDRTRHLSWMPSHGHRRCQNIQEHPALPERLCSLLGRDCALTLLERQWDM